MSQISATKDQLWRGGKITNRLSRFRHFRGHGVHSPFVYSIVRNILMLKKIRVNNSVFFDQLIQLEITRQTAIEIANLAAYCKFDSVNIDCVARCNGVIICSDHCSEEKIEKLAHHAAIHGTAIVIISPYKRFSLCNRLLKSSRSTSMDRLKYLIFFNNYLPKQHFKL